MGSNSDIDESSEPQPQQTPPEPEPPEPVPVRTPENKSAPLERTPSREFQGVFREYWFESFFEEDRTTGNCCENYITTTPDGRIYDFGGTYVYYSDDQGLSWTLIDDAILPYTGGEGAIAVAPNGDVVGIGWSPYAGDQVYGFKLSAATGTWEWSIAPIHTPFWDREWIVALPGPFTIDGETIDYLTLARGGTAYKDVLLMSTDGLNYYEVSLPAMEAISRGEYAAFDAGVDPMRDWTQPLQYTSITSVGPGVGLHTRGLYSMCHPMIDASGNWACNTLTEATLPDGPLVMDSQGHLHVIEWNDDDNAFTYHMSTNGGRNWTEVAGALPEGYEMLEFDFKAHAAFDQTVVAVHAENEDGQGQGMILRFRDIGGQPWHQETIIVNDPSGEGGGGGVSNQDGERYDFMSTAFLPDGRVVISTMSANHPSQNPVVTIEP